MTKNIHYDNETIARVRATDMTEFFSRYKGFSFKLQGGDYRCAEHNSLVVKGDKSRWYWNSKGVGGAGVIDYFMKAEGMTFQEAVNTALNLSVFSAITYTTATPSSCAKPKVLSLPEKGNPPYTRLFKYLCGERGIDVVIISEMIRQGKIYQDAKENAVFVGYDEKCAPRFASVRGTNPQRRFRMDCAGSDKRYSFSMEGSSGDALYIFESPIDALSHATLQNLFQDNKDAWKMDSKLSLGGITDIALNSYLKRHPNIKRLIFCLDNDGSGQSASEKFNSKYSALGYDVSCVQSQFKDFNDTLLYYKGISKNRKVVL
jgi:hypothetical protein